jgi:hypothetical protein
MKYNKITIGFVIQSYEEKDGKFVCTEQEFIASDDVSREDADEIEVTVDVDTDKEVYQCFDMVQPEE